MLEMFTCAFFFSRSYVCAYSVWLCWSAHKQLGNILAHIPRRIIFKKQQVNDARLSYFLSSTLSLSPFLLLLASLGWDMALAQFGRRYGRFGKRLFPPLTLSLPTLCCYGLGRGHIQDEKQVSQEKM